MSILQEPPAPALPVICDFFFEQTGPPGIATYDGDTYPYPPLPSDKGSDARYAWGTTPVFLAVEFFGTAHITEGKIKPHVIPPPGVSILEYFWDFGDGHTGHGPIVTHTYEVPDPTTSISLTILDSLGREFSTSKALSLLIVDFGYIYQRIRGKNTETPPKKQFAEGSGDFALSMEGTPTRIWIARGGKSVREETEKALSSDRASVSTHFFRKTTDYSLSSDKVIRTRHLARSTNDRTGTEAAPLPSIVSPVQPSVVKVKTGEWRQTILSVLGVSIHRPLHEPFYPESPSDVARSNMHRIAKATDNAVSEDTPTWLYLRALRATLKFVGELPKNTERTLKATLAFVGKLLPIKL